MMETDSLNLKDILDWYVWAGVDETVGEEPFGLTSSSDSVLEKRPLPVLKTSDKPVIESEERKATTELAQATVNACKGA